MHPIVILCRSPEVINSRSGARLQLHAHFPWLTGPLDLQDHNISYLLVVKPCEQFGDIVDGSAVYACDTVSRHDAFGANGDTAQPRLLRR